MNKTLFQPFLRSNSRCRNPTSIEKKKNSSSHCTHIYPKNSVSPLSLTHTDLLGAFRSDNISQATSHVAVKAPIKSAWCCKSLEWFGACKPLESHWAHRAKFSVGAWRGGGRGYMVGLAFYLMHHWPLRSCFNRQWSNNEVTMLLFFLSLTQTDTLGGSWVWCPHHILGIKKKMLLLIQVGIHL